MSLWAVDGCFSLSCFSEQKRLNSLPRRSLQGRSGSWGGWQDGVLSPCLGGMAGAWEETEDAEDILDWMIVMEIGTLGQLQSLPLISSGCGLSQG